MIRFHTWIRIYSLLILMLITSINTSAQHPGVIEGGVDISKFPEVSFVYHTNDPAASDSTVFWGLKEGVETKLFKVEHLPHENTVLPNNVVILWEDMAYNGQSQYNFTKNTLNSFLDKADIKHSDKIAIATFNRRKNTSGVLNNITNGFTNDKSQLISAVNNHSGSTEEYREFPNRSDLYTAIRESIDLLSSMKGAKSIIVFTSGYSMKNSGADSESQVLLSAQKQHVPVYIFQYYYKSGVAPESEGFAKSTYGSFHSYINSTDAGTDLLNLYPQITQRYKGNNFRITYESAANRGAESQTITLSDRGQDIQIQYVTPQHTFYSWITEHWIWSIIICIAFICLIVTLIFIVKKNKRNAKQLRNEIDVLERQRGIDLDNFNKSFSDLKESTKNHISEHQSAEETRAEKILHSLRTMCLEGQSLRLKCSDSHNTKYFTIDKPCLIIGRTGERDNDITFNDNAVSRKHAKIIYNGDYFMIIDTNSSNGLYLNGQKISQSIIKRGDVITLGNSSIVIM